MLGEEESLCEEEISHVAEVAGFIPACRAELMTLKPICDAIAVKNVGALKHFNWGC